MHTIFGNILLVLSYPQDLQLLHIFLVIISCSILILFNIQINNSLIGLTLFSSCVYTDMSQICIITLQSYSINLKEDLEMLFI